MLLIIRYIGNSANEPDRELTVSLGEALQKIRDLSCQGHDLKVEYRPTDDCDTYTISNSIQIVVYPDDETDLDELAYELREAGLHF